MKSIEREDTLIRKDLALLANEEVAQLQKYTTPFQIAVSKYDEDYFDDPRIAFNYKVYIARALVEVFGNLSEPLWVRKAKQ